MRAAGLEEQLEIYLIPSPRPHASRLLLLLLQRGADAGAVGPKQFDLIEVRASSSCANAAVR